MGFCDFSGDTVWKKFLDQLRYVTISNLSSNNLGHSLSDLFNLLRLGISSLTDLVSLFLGKSSNEDSQVVVIGSFYINMALDSRLPFFNHRESLSLVKFMPWKFKIQCLP